MGRQLTAARNFTPARQGGGGFVRARVASDVSCRVSGTLADVPRARQITPMSVETMYTLRKAPIGSLLFPELSVVEVVRDVQTDDGQHVPAGTRGTVVMVYGGGKAYEVEFARPVIGNTMLNPDVLRAV